ncbi:MAG: NADH-quinone oxidoreductase subunit M [Dehalococcoidia bacterium]|nr:NADH-quinone oxidoreductase subunit M [Dehalococcoidia bacterium]
MRDTAWLNIIVFLPAAGAIVLALALKDAKKIRVWATLVTFATLALSVIMYVAFDRSSQDFQFVTQRNWFPDFNVQYFLGVDGLSAPLVLLTALLGFASVIVSFSVKVRVKEYYVWLLLLETGVLGVFTSLDLLMFFLFWEVELLPMYLLISIWGSGRKEYSAMKFLIFTIAGSASMLIGILIIYFSMGTFDMVQLANTPVNAAVFSSQAVFWLLFIAFAIKLPVWPVHTWLPDAHTDAPTAVSVMLAGILLKMGGYGMIRLNVSIFPEVAKQYQPILIGLAVVSIILGALAVFRQKDLKRLVAYSSVSHMGFVLLGIGSLGTVGLTGAGMQMFAHGTITGMLFMSIGLIYERAHTRQIPELSGLASRMPIIAIMMVLAGLASLGLPSMSGFISELTVFVGTFGQYHVATIIAVSSIALTAGYILWTVQRVLFGGQSEKASHISDTTAIEMIPLLVMLAMIFLVGLYPSIITDYFKLGIEPLMGRLG